MMYNNVKTKGEFIMFCKKCGAEIDDQAVICVKCGCSTKEEIAITETPKAKKKINIMCLVGFILSLVSWLLALYGIVAIAGLTLSIIGVVQAKRKEERLVGLGIAGIPISACSLIYTIYTLIALATLLSTL